MDVLSLNSTVTIGAVLTVAGLVGSQVVLYVRTTTRIEAEGRAFRERFDIHALTLEKEMAGVHEELKGIRKDLSQTILNTAEQAVIIQRLERDSERLERDSENLDKRLLELEKRQDWGPTGTRGGGGGTAEA